MLGMQLLLDQLDDELREHGLSLPEYEIMVRLSESDGQMRMARLADALAHSRSRVTHTISRMEKSGLVRRTTSPEDGRGIVAVMTDEGWERLRAAAPTHVTGVREHLVDLVDAGDLAAVGRVFDAVSDALIHAHPEREIRQECD
ncbi:MarR family transcriptional regulator [Nocardioides sp. BSK12Z-4]|uniref:MarR family transcriptional regulator n=2 Tax=Nocardioides bruguierae TaxID=2945102 RepID=A0A9X2D6V3_9ACTN|nr:MarR family transcriptional regulator [Nocardioides bruguierae]MCM0620411.1 MarR family transcriptional regulator [Nocardioides bruguierae]